ncbi:hypothetical protein [Clostridium sp.]|uniref:hypothetical protein n=1 Tax=Clostridium sp. TaxID=1506 RepID=UPI002844F41E|nr:hypothetical protein [Clostridium sp.]MDR3597076.1 hypothetical protein [Clostridium sp.]
MVYTTNASTMALTRNCLALATSSAVDTLGLLQSKITYPNGNHSIIDLCTGVVSYKSRYRKQPKHNKVNDNPKEYEITPVYFDNQDSSEPLYRHGKVHILNVVLSAYHRDLFNSALQRAAEQDGCDLSEATVHIHHLENKRNNAIYNLLPVTDSEHFAIHNALRRGASTYDALVTALGAELVHSIYDTDYFDYGDGGGVYTAKIQGKSYIQHMLTQLSVCNLPVNTQSLKVKTVQNHISLINIEGMSIYQLLTALYNSRAISIVQ